MYIFYIKEDEQKLPIVCESWKNSEFNTEFIQLDGVKHIKDSIYSQYSVEQLTINKEIVIYFSKVNKDEIANTETKNNIKKEDKKIKKEEVRLVPPSDHSEIKKPKKTKKQKINREKLSTPQKSKWDF